MTIASVNLHSLRSSYPDLFLPDISRVSKAVHHIRLSADCKPLSSSQPGPVPLAKREALSKALKNMVKVDLIEPIQCSVWVHPLVVVQKEDGSIRLCTNVRALKRHQIVKNSLCLLSTS
ncbi:unnamed protein product [Dicrocoelium dendriticum]|nr:unnamed protein product [Dicrocoelium dendriticum]